MHEAPLRHWSSLCRCRYNENELRWAALSTWKFERTVDIEESLLAQSCVDLLLSGVDTVAEIQLNGQHLLSTDNAFRWVSEAFRRVADHVRSALLHFAGWQIAWGTVDWATSLGMCREYRIPVRDSLRPGSNTLTITIQPAIPEAERRAKSSPYIVPSVQVWSAVT
jgi:hypothetical protein